MGYVGAKEHGLAWFEEKAVEEVDAKAAHVTGKLQMDSQEETAKIYSF